MSDRQAEHWKCLRYSILRLLDEQPEISERAIAHRLGINTAAAHACIALLMARGHLEVRNESTAGERHHIRYTLTRSGVAFKNALAGRLFYCVIVDQDVLSGRIAMMQTALFHGGLPSACD